MGCVGAKGSKHETPEMREAQNRIEKQLRKAKKMQEKEIKLLLLGAGESGKSTLAKQMKIIYLTGWTEEEKKYYRDIVHNNVFVALGALVAASEQLGVPIEKKNQERAMLFAGKQGSSLQLTAELAKDVEELWKDKGIQTLYKRQDEFQLQASAGYFLSRVQQLAPAEYVPSDQDILRARAKTSGITETIFGIGEVQFRLVDVGGQRSERKKWIHCFQDVTALIFFVSLAEYNQNLYEDESVNRMHESVRLFDEICNSRWFRETTIILFFNKVDLFDQKIKRVDLKCCFPDYKHGCERDKALDFLEHKFQHLNRTDKLLYSHITCATDTSNVIVVFNVVRDILVRDALDNSGFSL